MEMKTFAENLAAKMQSQVTEGVTFRLDETVKTNYKGCCIQAIYEDCNVGPVLYPEDFFYRYENGEAMDDLARSAVETVEKHHEEFQHFDTSFLTTEYAKEHAYFDIGNAAINQSLADSCAHIQKLDLIAIPKIAVDVNTDGIGSVTVGRELQKMRFRMTDEELLDICLKNTCNQEFTVTGLFERVRTMMQENEVPEGVIADMAPDRETLYIITNKKGIGGAVALFAPKALDAACEKIGIEETFIIPSSRHEILLADPQMVEDPKMLHEMCTEVNESEVSQSDYLSDNIYHYDTRTHQLNICNSLDELASIQDQMEKTEELLESLQDVHTRRM